MFPFGERFGILAVPRGDPGGWMRGGSETGDNGRRRRGDMNPARSLVGGDRPGCDFMITTLGERRAGTSTGCLMLAVLVGLADVERDLIRTHTAEGRSRAKAQGKHIRRPPSLTPAQQKEAISRRAQGATLEELARSYNISRATISRLTP